MAENLFRPGMSDAEVEEQFLDSVPGYKACFPELLAVIGRFAAEGKLEMTGACAALLEDALVKNGAEDELVELLALRPAWQDAAACSAYCAEKLQAFGRGGHRRLALFAEASGLAGGVEPREAFRRLKVLRALVPGKCCYEKTWGLGRVADLDDFERKLVVDFEGKRAHRLSYAYAAEAIIPLADDHILALKLQRPDEFARRVKEDQAGIVKSFLELFGAMNVQRLRALLAGLVIPENEWTSFWAAARSKLAGDPRVQMPAGRSDPIVVLSGKKEFDARWRADFLALRDVESIMAQIELLYAAKAPPDLPADFKAAVEDRLKFAVRGMGKRHQETVVRALLLADAAGIAPAGLFDLRSCAAPLELKKTLAVIPARMIRPFLDLLGQGGAPVADALLEILPDLENAALAEAILYCARSGREEQVHAGIRSLVQGGAAGSGLMSWLGRNLALAGEKNICRPETFAMMALSLLQKALAAGKRKEIGQLMREVFTDKTLLAMMLGAMDEGQRMDFCRRLNALPGMSAADKVEIAARVIPLYSNLAGAFGAPPVAIVQPRLTSFRSYRAKQLQLEKIINEEIPRNSREIGVARSYGDLRENFEYKAAREMQGLLMRRKAELEQMLAAARGSDFSGLPHDVAGMGTRVTLRLSDGKTHVYHILGEFDSDDKLGIISCRSKLAESLAGCRAGARVKIPGEHDDQDCLVEAVGPLPQEIRDWINANVAVPGAG